MGLFDSKCSKCGSLEHVRDNCPHDLLSSKCSKCGSVNHSRDECPHDILSSRCSKCGSLDHNRENCPQGIFSTQCSKCGSTEHAREDCPHDLFSTECIRCGSLNHATDDCPQRGFRRSPSPSPSSYSSGGSGEMGGIKLIGFIIAICIALAVLVLALTIAPFVLLIIYLATLRRNPWWAIGGMVVSIILAWDFGNAGWLWRTIYEDWQIGTQANMFLLYLVMLGITTGFLAEKFLRDTWPYDQQGKWLERPIFRGIAMVLGLGLIFLLPGFMVHSKLQRTQNIGTYGAGQHNTQPYVQPRPQPSYQGQHRNNGRAAPQQQTQQRFASITGDRVNVRSAPQISSRNKLGILNRGDRVTILASQVPASDSNAMLTIGSTTITLNGGSLRTLEKGKAVTLLQKLPNGRAKVKTTLPNNQTIIGTVLFRQLKSSQGSTWYRVQKGNMIGWVHGDFVRG